MSKLAKKPVSILEGVNINLENDIIKVNGPKGNLSFKIPSGVGVKVADGRVSVSLKDKNSEGFGNVRQTQNRRDKDKGSRYS